VQLSELLARLAAHTTVDGVAVLGSTATNTLRPVSDFDVLVVLHDDQLPLLVGVTTVEGRLTDLVFATSTEVDQLLSGGVADPDAWLGRLSSWVHDGRIVFDRSGRLERLRTRAVAPTDDGSAHSKRYETWFSINYNLVQNRRLVSSRDETDQMALELRLLYSVFELLTGYFRLRGIPWPGEKAAIRHIRTNDPPYLARLRECLAASDSALRLPLYELLAEQTLEPFGALWRSGETRFQFRPGTTVDRELVAEAERFWTELAGP
jgi:predicted nucleotidyltransferase